MMCAETRTMTAVRRQNGVSRRLVRTAIRLYLKLLIHRRTALIQIVISMVTSRAWAVTSASRSGTL